MLAAVRLYKYEYQCVFTHLCGHHLLFLNNNKLRLQSKETKDMLQKAESQEIDLKHITIWLR